MFNKNDPLISAVQEVMKRNHAEREAAKVVNEKFGVYDRKALPHERQGEWDAAFKSVLNESDDMGPVKNKEKTKTYKHKTSGKEIVATKHPGDNWEIVKEELKGNQHRIDVASADGKKKPDGKLTKHDFEHLRSMKEETLEEKTIASKKAKKGTKYKVQAKNSDREGSSITLRQGKRIKDFGDYDRGARAFFMKKGTYDSAEDMLKTVKEEQLDEKKMSDAQMKKREEIVKSMKSGMSGFKKRYGERAKDVMYATATKQAMKEDNEGFNNRHGLSKNASAKKQVVAEIVVKPGNDTPAGRAAAKAFKDNKGSGQALPLQAGQRLSPIGDRTRGRVVKTINPYKEPAFDLDAARKEAQRRREAGEPVLQAKDVPGLNRDPKAVEAAQDRSNQIMRNAKTGGQPLIRSPRTYGSDPTNTSKGKRAGAVAPKVSRGSDPTNTPSGQRAGAAAPSSEPEKIKTTTQTTPTPDFQFTDKEKAGKVSAERLKQFYQQKGLKASGKTSQDLRTFMNAAKNKTLNTKITPATDLQKANQAKLQAQKTDKTNLTSVAGGQGVAAVPGGKANLSPTPNVKPARNSTLAAPSATAATTMATATKSAGQMAVDRMKAQNLAKSQTSSMFGGSVNKPKPLDTTRDIGKYAGDMRDTRGPAAAERLANPTFVPRPSPGTIRRNSTLAAPSAMAATAKPKPTTFGPK